MLEDWLDSPEPEDGFQETIMQIAGEDNSAELLKTFSPRDEQEMIVALEPVAEEEAESIDFVELYEELESLKRRVNMQSRHIQQIKLETGGGAYHPREQLEEVGVERTQEEMREVNLSEEEVEQQLSGETAELDSATKWPASATGDEDNRKGQIDQIGKKEKDHTFQCAQEMEEEEHSEEWLKFFSQEAEKEMIVECEPIAEERAIDSMDFVDLCEELEALVGRVRMQSQLIQQVKLEIDGKDIQQNEMKEKR
jgi:hypothetical protein